MKMSIELSEGNTKRRVVLLIVVFVITFAAFGYGINSLVSMEPGFTEITVLSSNQPSCGKDFTFYYNVGAGETSATEEYKALRTLYTRTAQESYQIFNADVEVEGCYNLWYANAHVNETVTIEPALYGAFALLEESGARYHYLAPMYEMYFSLFQCMSDQETVDYDPYSNEELREFYEETAVFINDPSAVKIELFEDNKIRISVSGAYLDFAKENGITRFVDLGWMKNALIADHMAAVLAENGYTAGVLMSYDGFMRGLGNSKGAEYSLTVSHREGTVVSDVGALHFTGEMSGVYLHDYPVGNGDGGNYYVRDDGQIRHPFVEPSTGLCKSALPEIAAFSPSLSCAEIALKIAPVYIAGSFDKEAGAALELEGITVYYCEEGKLRRGGEEGIK
ncbi:MAG: hypothetical protein HFG41_06435 [Coprococcus sp.]|nr:hypothetical protein [Coprococcus sp.]